MCIYMDGEYAGVVFFRSMFSHSHGGAHMDRRILTTAAVEDNIRPVSFFCSSCVHVSHTHSHLHMASVLRLWNHRGICLVMCAYKLIPSLFPSESELLLSLSLSHTHILTLLMSVCLDRGGK